MNTSCAALKAVDVVVACEIAIEKIINSDKFCDRIAVSRLIRIKALAEASQLIGNNTIFISTDDINLLGEVG